MPSDGCDYVHEGQEGVGQGVTAACPSAAGCSRRTVQVRCRNWVGVVLQVWDAGGALSGPS